MNRYILWTVGGFAVLSAAYLGFVKLAFAPDGPAQVAEAPPLEAVAPPAVPVPEPPPRDVAQPRPAPLPAARPDTSAAAADTAAVRRLTVELARRTREVAHVGKPVARHVASGTLGLGPDGCTEREGVRLCLVPSPVGGWQVVGASQGYAVAARGPAALGDPLAVSVVAPED